MASLRIWERQISSQIWGGVYEFRVKNFLSSSACQNFKEAKSKVDHFSQKCLERSNRMKFRLPYEYWIFCKCLLLRFLCQGHDFHHQGRHIERFCGCKKLQRVDVKIYQTNWLLYDTQQLRRKPEAGSRKPGSWPARRCLTHSTVLSFSFKNVIKEADKDLTTGAHFAHVTSIIQCKKSLFFFSSSACQNFQEAKSSFQKCLEPIHF